MIAYVLIIDFLAIMSPGPDFFMVLRNSLTNSLQAGIYTALGITLGSCIIFSLGIFGLGIVIANSKLLFTVIKLVGVCYLIYLAFKSLVTPVKIEEPQLVYSEENLTKSWQYFKLGLLCNITNPKAFMFTVSLATYVAAHGSPRLDGPVVIIGSGCATLLWFSLVSCIFGTVAVRKLFYQRQRLINIIFGLVLLYVATKILFL